MLSNESYLHIRLRVILSDNSPVIIQTKERTPAPPQKKPRKRAFLGGKTFENLMSQN